MTPRTGRPPSTGRTKYLPYSLRLTPDERDQLEAAAKASKRTIGAYLLFHGLKAAAKDLAAMKAGEKRK